MSAIADRYLERLSAADLDILAVAAGHAESAPGDLSPTARYHETASGLITAQFVDADDTDRPGQVFRRQPALIEAALLDQRTATHLFDPTHEDRALLHASPFLVFAAAVHRGVLDLGGSSFVEERIGPHKRLPIFDTNSLSDHFGSPERRITAIEHLASYTRVASGPVWTRRGNRWRKTRYSELDPLSLGAMLDGADDAIRPGVYRRLGDVALFLTGVFPDHTARQPVHPIELERLLRTLRQSPEAGRLGTPDVADVERLVGTQGMAGLLGWLGPRWYRLAAAHAPLPNLTAMLDDAAEGFDLARRFLTHVTDHYLFPHRDRWFGGAPG